MKDTILNIQEELDIKFDKSIKILQSEGYNKKSKFLCLLCGKEWNKFITNVLKYGVCDDCKNGRTRKEKFLEVSNYIESQNCKILSNEYFNNKQKIEILFQCGHNSFISFDAFKRGQRCCICGHNKVGELNRMPISFFEDKCKNNKFIFLGFPDGYKDRKSKIEFDCEFGHKNIYTIGHFIKNGHCSTCRMIDFIKSVSGSNAPNWKGGVTEFSLNIRNSINKWKKESMKFCDYKCVITGERFDVVHHLYPFHKIIEDAVCELNLQFSKNISGYSDEENILLTNKILELHDKHPLGVCLKKSIHEKFHLLYGYNATEEDFYNFKTLVQTGEININ